MSRAEDRSDGVEEDEGIGCTTCTLRADQIVVPENGSGGFPFCPTCADTEVEAGGREYSIEAFYFPNEYPQCSQMVGGPNNIKLFEPGMDGSEDAWVKADNNDGISFVDLEDTT